eukprot:scaffold182709_cov17-Tisochrysis_lutea.AAC.1
MLACPRELIQCEPVALQIFCTHVVHIKPPLAQWSRLGADARLIAKVKRFSFSHWLHSSAV